MRKIILLTVCLVCAFFLANAQSAMEKAARERNERNEKHAQEDKAKQQNSNSNTSNNTASTVSGDYSATYYHGFRRIKDEKGKWGYTSEGFTFKSIPPQYEYAEDFEYGLAVVKQNGKWGVINNKGELIVPFE